MLSFLGTTISFAQQIVLEADAVGSTPVTVDSLLINSYRSRITVQSNGLVIGKISELTINIKIPISDDTYIETLYFTDTDSTLIFFYEESITTESSTHFIIFDKKTLELIIKEDIFASNFNKPVFKDNFIYLVTFGFVGKYDLTELKYDWKYDYLYNRENGTFNSIENPKFVDDKVIFISEGQNGVVDSLIINDINGTLLYKPTN